VLHDDLRTTAEPTLRTVQEHPFWCGLRDGTLPPEALLSFVEQDTGHLLPQYARALSRCAAAAGRDSHVSLLARATTGTLEARDRLRTNFAALAGELGTPSYDPTRTVPRSAATAAHTDFFAAASGRSLAAGVGALLPMVLFNMYVSADLVARLRPGSRYAGWIDRYQPGERYQYAVTGFEVLADEVAADGGPAATAELTESFRAGVQHERAFADAAWNRHA